MFNTGLDAAQRGRVSADPKLTVIRNGKVWVPVEATLMSESFSQAWAEGAAKYNEHVANDALGVVSIEDAWNSYQPVTLSPADFKLALPQAESVSPLVERERDRLLRKSLKRLTQPYRAILAANPKHRQAKLQVGILKGRYGLYEEAIADFAEVLSQHPGNSAALNNRGNIFLQQGKVEQALEAYGQAEAQAPNDPGIKVNLAMAHYRAGDLEAARKKLAEAKRIDPAVAERNERLANMLAK
jgi:tetratricopeptide (TPR) repeat protein